MPHGNMTFTQCPFKTPTTCTIEREWRLQRILRAPRPAEPAKQTSTTTSTKRALLLESVSLILWSCMPIAGALSTWYSWHIRFVKGLGKLGFSIRNLIWLQGKIMVGLSLLLAHLYLLRCAASNGGTLLNHVPHALGTWLHSFLPVLH